MNYLNVYLQTIINKFYSSLSFTNQYQHLHFRTAIPARFVPESGSAASHETDAGEPTAPTECHADAPDAGDDAPVLHEPGAHELADH